VADIFEQAGIRGALADGGVEIDLDGANIWELLKITDFVNKTLMLKRSENGLRRGLRISGEVRCGLAAGTRFDSNDGDQRRARRDAKRLQAGPEE
jgi:hypothetical protein